jgi:hypothetical protein
VTDKPTFATNRTETGETVAAAINDHIGWLADKWTTPIRLSIATAYINPGGLRLIEPSLVDKAGSVRLLLGAEPEAPTAHVRRLEEDSGQLPLALEGSVRTMVEDRNLLGFELEAESSARRFVDWLARDSVEVRRFEHGFLHGKAYLADTPEDEDAEGVIAGSSNLTYPGLATSHELNLGHYDPGTVNQVRDWFEEMWTGGVDYKHALIRIYGQRFEEHSAYLIYLRMLYEKYGAEVEALADASPTGLGLTSFQSDGVTLANWILAKYSGVIVADGVGLGKTYIAGELIREAVEDRRQRVLVVAPAALRDGPWRAFRCSVSRSCRSRNSLLTPSWGRPASGPIWPIPATSTRWWSSTRPTPSATSAPSGPKPSSDSSRVFLRKAWFCSPLLRLTTVCGISTTCSPTSSAMTRRLPPSASPRCGTGSSR